MGQVLDSWPFEEGVGRPQKYPWDEWQDLQPRKIMRGEDYEISSENMQVNLHTRAAKVGLKVRTRKTKTETGEGLVFQFRRPTTDFDGDASDPGETDGDAPLFELEPDDAPLFDVGPSTNGGRLVPRSVKVGPSD